MKCVNLHLSLSVTGFCCSVESHWLEKLTALHLGDTEVSAVAVSTALCQA